MLQYRFVFLSRFFSLEKHDEPKNKADKIHKIRHFIEYSIEKWQENFYPTTSICVDETIIQYKGKFKFKVFFRNKPIKSGILLYSLADSATFYMLKVEVFQGPAEHKDELLNPTERNFGIVNRLIDKYIDNGHIVFMDNYYTTIKLAEYLYSRNTGCCGTLRFHRTGEKGLDSNMIKTEVRTYLKKDSPHVLLTIWYDTVFVQAISNCFPINMIMHKLLQVRNTTASLFKYSPLVFREYNKNAKAIDKNNQLINLIKPPVTKTFKWWIKAYFYFLTITLTNAYLIYKHNTIKRIKRKRSYLLMSRREFILCIIRELLQSDGGVRKIYQKKFENYSILNEEI